jgi:hypothetical protein
MVVTSVIAENGGIGIDKFLIKFGPGIINTYKIDVIQLVAA